MNEPIVLPVEYLGATIELPLTIITHGYTYQLQIDIEGKKLVFEKDDQGEYRVIDDANGPGHINKSLVLAILTTLREL
ncbi:hypothetical protein [Dyadobacter alkalitolerans]|uniref:hypothetical protein n=1 Tax=Dyadobacter alkalitolerans TaxID=492736 RepID=UPI00040EE6CC|nr:hypothetical protein [Dyadobacter alkalitolerans]